MSQNKPVPRTSKQIALVTKVIKMYEGGTSIQAISKKFGISRTTFYRWYAIFASEKTNSTEENVKTENKPLKSIDESALKNKSSEEQIESLKEALRKAELRADLYNEIINVAESKFKIAIRKKAGTKQ